MVQPNTAAAAMIPPGATIGMLGGGQLGRMTAMAAARLGYRTHVFSDEIDSPCAQVCAATTVAAFSDRTALEEFAQAVDVVTLEWENVPTATLDFLAHRVPVRPGAAVLAVTRDRIAEKSAVNRLGLATAPWRAVRSPEDVANAMAELGTPAILKATQLGYDGKGQVRLEAGSDPVIAWTRMGGAAGIVEGFVDFACEVSVIVARRPGGQTAVYPTVENRHRHHILDRTLVPAAIPPAVAAEAERVARTVSEALGVVGLLAVEMFITRDQRVLVNELAPRPHNSGHWTLDACATSQFEQLVRAVCDLPLGPTTITAAAEMENLIGDAVDRWPVLVADPAARLHLYGKRETRPGRKMGHVTWIRPG
ncbi:N5-carboxyaminoimidazole ribonucleotide synthase [Azospirillaceae bacterium]